MLRVLLWWWFICIHTMSWTSFRRYCQTFYVSNWYEIRPNSCYLLIHIFLVFSWRIFQWCSVKINIQCSIKRYWILLLNTFWSLMSGSGLNMLREHHIIHRDLKPQVREIVLSTPFSWFSSFDKEPNFNRMFLIVCLCV